MTLLRIFDYIYYRIYHIYKTKWKDSTPGAYATSLVALLQSLLFAIIPIFVYSAINSTKVTLSKKYFIGIFLFFFLFNLFRYYKFISYLDLAKRWEREEVAKHKQRGIYVLLFIIITLVIFFCLITVLGKINRGEI